MRSQLMGSIMLLAVFGVVSPRSFAQAQKPLALSQAFGHPDLSGVWDSSPSFQAKGRGYYVYAFGPDEPPMTPWAEAKYKKERPTFGPHKVPVAETTDPVYRCLPPGVPRIYFHIFPMEILEVPGRIIELFEHDHFVRQIWLNRTKHPDDLIPSYMGDSIGHWEGDTLVVDTVGFNGKIWVDRIGHPSSEKLHVIERIRRVDQDHLQIGVTIDDPVAYTKPWGGEFLFARRPTWHIREFACVDYFQFLNFEKSTLPDSGK